ncbi:GSCFA domain-containing protein [Roseococcus sp. SDR]|uniref:GSCFA domain-containing protein n=1 Tax=Roseococcus sp. SDR TaxID=2835532 RepID=UPI001BCAE9F4|nr:GSCFA domain-containing protein [Roseococcus sp. SDR]MBS7788970.1 GSCFA domain-containing protein [Roseococcus sp. SDR]MBV1844284.1 GSCFA domain-containing protein [Roseococcus sp. SDR]
MADHPYASMPPYASWRRSFQDIPMTEVDPVAKFPMTVSPTDKVATAGSCFAQHIARRLRASGFTYFVTEPGHPLLSEKLRAEFGYGVFSARFGNIYTTRQLRQLFDRCYGRFSPVEDMWRKGARFLDPFRPTIQPDGFASEAEFRADRAQHLAAVRRMFEELDIFVFTLGLTEGFVSREDGAAFPVCPGVAGGTFDPERHIFVNERAAEVVENMSVFIAGLRRVNPRARVILTVSPVPLKATAEDRHVLQSTVYSKSVLRVAAQEIADSHADVAYFPSYEIITGAYNRGAYFGPDLREVEEAGVEHVMRLFFRHATATAGEAPPPAPAPPRKKDRSIARARAATAVVCDEELLDIEPVGGAED